MAITPVQMLVSSSKYNIKCPYSMTATRIVVHNTANNACARDEIRYMINNNNECSFHFAIDDKEVVQGIPLNRMAWHAGDGNGNGNMKGIGIEICYSKYGGAKFTAAEKLAAKFIAQLLKERGWDIKKVTKHQDYSGKYCPHRTLDLGWNRFLDMIKAELNGTETKKETTTTTKTTTTKVNVKYRVRTKEHGWLPSVINTSDYAGYQEKPIIGIDIKVDKGTVKYRVHVKGGKWLGWVTGNGYNESAIKCAGNGNPIDAIQIYYYTPNNVRPLKRAAYRVSPVNNNYYPWQYDTETTNGQDGYAGGIGGTISKLQVKIV